MTLLLIEFHLVEDVIPNAAAMEAAEGEGAEVDATPVSASAALFIEASTSLLLITLGENLVEKHISIWKM